MLVALTCSSVLLLLLSGIASAHGRPTSQHPNSCFWNVIASNTQNIVINGSNIGTYAAAVLQWSCQSTTHSVDGDLYITGGACAKGSLAVSWWVNGGKQTGNSQNTNSIGPSACSTQELFWQSGNYIGVGFTFCVQSVATYSGNPLSANAYVCKSV